jgi:hypothetical protein
MWDAQDLLNCLNRECAPSDIIELYCALLAYELGATEINNELMKKVMTWYYDNDTLTSFINQDIIDYANELLDNE